MKDKLLEVKLSFMITICLELEIFLKFYQSDAPLLPFMFDDLYEIIKSLMSRIIVSNLLD